MLTDLLILTETDQASASDTTSERLLLFSPHVTPEGSFYEVSWLALASGLVALVFPFIIIKLFAGAGDRDVFTEGELMS